MSVHWLDVESVEAIGEVGPDWVRTVARRGAFEMTWAEQAEPGSRWPGQEIRVTVEAAAAVGVTVEGD